MDSRRGWFADQVNDPAEGPVGLWVAVLQADGMLVALDGPWFETEAECLAWLRSEVVGRGMYDDVAE